MSVADPAGAVDAPPIFVVDDDETSRMLICASLLALRLVNPCIMIGDGDEAVEQLLRSIASDGQVPALVMLDVQMPGRDGLDVLRWMRERPQLRDVPVIMLTATSDVDSIREAYDVGAASYLVKPVAFQALADVLRGLGRPWVLL